MHQRIVVNGVCLGWSGTLEEDLTTFASLGVDRVGVSSLKVLAAGDKALPMLRSGGFTVDYLLHRNLFDLPDRTRWQRQADRAGEALDLAVELGTSIVYVTTGTAGDLEWNEAFARLCEAIVPVAEHACAKGIRLLVETTNPQFSDVDMLHTLRDSVEFAQRAGIGVCVDLHACWAESHLRQTIEAAAPLTHLVQVSDYRPGSRTMDRSVPGQGIVPLARIISWLLDAGYAGQFDLELFGDQGMPDDEAVRRGVDYLGELLYSLGVQG